ncbi:MAG: GntR family transcriptional regulator [Pseudoclavibacter sp.]
MDDGRPLFVQIAERVEDQIVDGTLAEETRAPSKNELAGFYRLNPATAAKGVNMLVDKGVLYKRRGIGMFVAAGARERVLAERRAEFVDTYIAPLIAEARRLGLSPDEVADDVARLLREQADAAGTT